jgi:hypothetical protein
LLKRPRAPGGHRSPVAVGDAALPVALDPRVHGDELTVLVNMDLIDQCMNINGSVARAVRHAVVVAGDRDYAVAAQASLQLEGCAMRSGRQRLQCGTLGGESLIDQSAGRAMSATVGHAGRPLGQLRVHIGQIPEAPAEKEILADVAKRTLDFTLGLRSIGGAGARREVVMLRERHEAGVVDDMARAGFLRTSRSTAVRI